jgi:anti-anti-sigma factor
VESRAGTIEVETDDRVTVIRLLGEHDLATTADLHRALRSATASGTGVVVSLMDATFIDSGTVHAFYAADEQLRERNRRLVLHVNTASMVRRVLDLSGLCTAVPCTPSIETARELAGVPEWETVWSPE